MNRKNILIVGDKFTNFAEGKDALTFSQLRHLIKQKKIPGGSQAKIYLIPGQGFSDVDTQTLLDEARLSQNRKYFDFSLFQNRPKRASTSLSHKSDDRNTLLSVPKRIGEDHYQMQLMLDENCELMGDHQSGQHVQGMVLFEAARQSLLVVTEAFYLTQQSNIKHAFIFNKMAVTFSHFAFPIDAKLDYCIKEKKERKTRMSFVVDITIEQCGVVAASFEAEFSVFKHEFISLKEGTQAQQALGDLLASPESNSAEEHQGEMAY